MLRVFDLHEVNRGRRRYFHRVIHKFCDAPNCRSLRQCVARPVQPICKVQMLWSKLKRMELASTT